VRSEVFCTSTTGASASTPVALPVMTAPPGMAMDTVLPVTTARPSHFTCIRAAASANSGAANSRANDLARFKVPITLPHYRTAEWGKTIAFCGLSTLLKRGVSTPKPGTSATRCTTS